MRIANGVEMLEISGNVRGTPRTIYPTLVWDTENTILVDAGFPGQLSLFRQAIEAAGVAFDRLDLLIVTHHDIDHIGGLASIRDALQGRLKIMAHVEEVGYIEGHKVPLKLAQLEANLSSLTEDRKKFYESMKTGFQNGRANVDVALTDGEKLPYCGGITVIHTPGHTLGHICLYLERTKTLVAGDELSMDAAGGLAPGLASNNFDTPMALKSMKKLTQYDIQAVICYHGGLFKDHCNERITALARG